MPIEELEQAVHAAKWGNAEEDIAEVIARVFEIPRAAVVRVMIALHYANEPHVKKLLPHMDLDMEVEPELSTAIHAAVRHGAQRVMLRRRIDEEKPVYVLTKKLIQRKRDVCNGCPFSIRCITEQLSSPERCYNAGPPIGLEIDVDGELPRFRRIGSGLASAQPLRMTDDGRVTVTCKHPQGTFVVSIEDCAP